MAIDDKKQPIIIKKIKKGGHAHHGGSWKVAYADFVTAMMAFFLLMWLLGSTTQEERAGIADYFQNPSAIAGPGGASTSMIKLGGSLEIPRGESNPLKDNPLETPTSKRDLDESLEDKLRLDELLQKLVQEIDQNEALREFRDQLLIDITSEGLRIQIVDKENRPMFDLGGTQLKPYTQEILHDIASIIDTVPNRISITGHTDARPFVHARRDYDNWELSADRANTARRELLAGGMDGDKVGRVVGLADSVMFNKADPYDPINRRISIIVLNRATERAIGLDEGTTAPSAPEPGIDLPSPIPTLPTPPQPPPPAVGTINPQQLDAAFQRELGPAGH